MKLACALGVFFAIAGLLEGSPRMPIATSDQPEVSKASSEEIMKRQWRAEELARDGKLTEAAEEYVWVWGHTEVHLPDTSIVTAMRDIASRSPEARARFVVLRDQAATRLQDAAATPRNAVDWAALNQVVGEPSATISWYRTAKADPRWSEALRQIADHLESSLAGSGEWAEIAGLHAEPIKVVEMLHTVALQAPGGRPEPKAGEQTMQYQGAVMLRQRAGWLYAGLLAAEREQDAQALAARARELDPSFAMMRALVAAAVRAGQARPEHVAWYHVQGKEVIDDTAMAALGRAVVYESANELRAALERSGKMPAP